MARFPTQLALLSSAMLLCACVSTAQSEQPAIISNPSEAAFAELSAVIAQALGGTPVTLAKDALTRDSTLFIERVPARDPTGARLSGRDLDKPEQFQLVMAGDRCLLLRSSTGTRSALKEIRCRKI